VSGGDQVRFTIQNDSNQDIWYVYISPVENDYWGEDLLGSDILSAGSSYEFQLTPGAYDLRVDGSDQNALETEWNINITTDQTWVFSGSDTPVSTGDGELDYTATPNFGSVALQGGFLPDPHEVAIVSGGTVNVRGLSLGTGCTGYASSAPDFRINWSGTASRLRIFFVADGNFEDATMIVNDASGRWHCNDDHTGLNPLVEINNPPAGQMDVWVGSYSSGDFIAGTLYITELDLP